VTLTLILSGRAYKEHEFPVFQKLRIGRSEDCEVHIDNVGVSRYQCEIINLSGSYQLRALSNSQPTFVNGTRIESCDLRNGDGIGFGKFMVGFQCTDSWATIAQGPSVAGGMTGVATLGDAAAEARAKADSATQVRGYVSLGEKDERDTRRLFERGFLSVGKGEGCDVPLSGWMAPRLGALLVRDPTGFSVVDVSPKGNVLQVNGKATQGQRLSHGDRLEVRGQVLHFYSGAPPD
jgi:predicted component of type VI protein secretion system